MKKSKKSTASKPEWDESIPGPLMATLATGERRPAFSKPTKAEIEAARKEIADARELSQGLGSNQMSPKQKWLEGTRSREELHRLNFDYFSKAKPKEVGGKKRKTEQLRLHRYGLVCALRDLGRFEEALALAEGGKRARPGFKIVADQITEWMDAVYCDDFALDKCGCQRKAESVEVGKRTVEIALKRRSPVAQLFSLKHGKVVDLWKCSGCGMLCAHDLGPPESQVELHDLRHQAEQAEVGRQGRQRPAMKDAASLADHVLMKR